jgi:transcriptional regulator with GAF, ATPase, and Fis domain
MDWLNADSGETIWVPAAHPAPVKNAITTPARVIAPGTASQEPAITGASASPTATVAPATSPLNGLAVPPTAQNAALRAEAAKSIAPAPEPRGEVALRFQTGLRLVAKLAQIMTSAEGAAIALTSSSQDPRATNTAQMICRASNGRAPEAGAVVWTGSGITGECLRSRSMVRCEDTHVDPRVDAEACRALQVRSIVAVPIFSGETIIGILEVLSGAVRGFDESGIRLLPTLAALVSHLAHTAGAIPESRVTVPAEVRDADLAQLAQSIKTQLVDQEQGRVNVNPRAIWPRANG